MKEIIRISGNISVEVHTKLVKIAKADSRSLSYIITKALTEYAKNHDLTE